jgi:hypothetical protein
MLYFDIKLTLYYYHFRELKKIIFEIYNNWGPNYNIPGTKIPSSALYIPSFKNEANSRF